jgi:hypothetical protein
MFAGKAFQVLPSRALPSNIRLCWKGLPGTDILACYENPLITTVKSFVVQAPGCWKREGIESTIVGDWVEALITLF